MVSLEQEALQTAQLDDPDFIEVTPGGQLPFQFSKKRNNFV